jgi:hypothetical protein
LRKISLSFPYEYILYVRKPSSNYLDGMYYIAHQKYIGKIEGKTGSEFQMKIFDFQSSL